MFCTQKTILRTASAAVIMTVLSAHVTANAATLNPGLKAPVGKIESISIPFSDITTQASDPILDWQNPRNVIEFDLSNTYWTKALSAVLSIDPIGRVDATTPIYMRLNNGKEIKLSTKGQGFDARIKLDPSELKETGNTLVVYLGSPSGEQCFLPQHGKWSINMKTSSLKIISRTKTRNYVIEDLVDKLKNPLLKPDNIGLIARGSNASKYQALIAQSIGLYMDEVPRFTTAKYSDQLDFIIGQHADIKSLVKNKKALEKVGPRVFVDSGRPLRVVITGHSKADVDRAVRAFAQYQLPSISSDYVDAGLLSLQPRLRSKDVIVTQARTKLSDMGNLDFSQSWKPGESDMTFDVEDPSAAQGEILLKLNSPNTLIDTKSYLTLYLNGRSLGQTNLDKKRKSVSFNVPKGVLKGQNNLLSLKPSVQNTQITNCSQLDYKDNALLIERGSRLILEKSDKTPTGDVSHMMATGAPFSDLHGEDTLLVLPENPGSYNMVLSMLAKFSKSSGQSWANAEFTRDANSVERLGKNRNILFLTPFYQLPQTLKDTAPTTLKLALSGRSARGEPLLNESIRQYASNDILDRLDDTSRAPSSANSINRGGVTALYESPFDKQKVVGIITNTPQESFERSMGYLKKSNYWNAVEGSVARWNNKSVLMTDLSLELPNFVRSAPDLNFVDTVKYKFDEIKTSTLDYTHFEWPDVRLSDFSLPAFTPPDLNLEEFKFPKFDLKNLKEKFKRENTSTVLELRETKQPNIISSTPSLRRSSPGERVSLKIMGNEKSSPQTRNATRSSFLDQALSEANSDKKINPTLRGQSQTTHNNGDINSRRATQFKTAIATRFSSVKSSWTRWYKDLPLFKNNGSDQYEYKGTDQTFSLLLLLLVLSLGGLFISLGFSSKKRK